VRGNVVDVHQRRIFGGEVVVEKGVISGITETGETHETYLMPGFVDGHIHIESSMLVPSEFARMAVVHGTVATVSDPHEIANVLGVGGVEFMIENGGTVPFKFHFGAPSCVPATSFETAGATLDTEQVAALLRSARIGYLSEMMNFPGVLSGDAQVMGKIAAARAMGKPVDGHAPGLRGERAARYFGAGISTDHECVSLEEALDKLRNPDVKILIREGSAARNFEALHGLISSHPGRVMLCSDDKHPDELERGHINTLAARAIGLGHELFDVLTVACVNPVRHYSMNVGMLRVGEPADFIEVGDLREFGCVRTWIGGELVAERGKARIDAPRAGTPNRFCATKKAAGDFAVTARGKNVRVIEAFDGQLITRKLVEEAKIVGGNAVADVSRDILKIAVVNRYAEARVATGFIRGFGLSRGAIASSVAHDSHNIVAVGVDDESIAAAVNALVDARGGLAVVDGERVEVLALPVAGLMSNEDGRVVAREYAKISAAGKGLGSLLAAPFMTLSFMALLVIPSLKISDKGVFDGERFELVEVFED
jgi:adenine deaminase